MPNNALYFVHWPI